LATTKIRNKKITITNFKTKNTLKYAVFLLILHTKQQTNNRSKTNKTRYKMFKTNQYFDGNVVSIGMDSVDGNATVGVMAAGEYEFGTSSVEVMTVISGELTIQQPGETEWKNYRKFESFVVAKDVKFKVKCTQDTPYLCLYK
jgi:uncharacterized protein YaiE (UPF0345 family)